MNISHFYRIFKTVTGLNPRAYTVGCGHLRLRQSLIKKNNIAGIIYDIDYRSKNPRFYSKEEDALEMMPGVYRADSKGICIMFAIGHCSLGEVLVAHSGRGICAISLGDDADQLLRELQQTFPCAELLGGKAGYQQLIAQIVEFIEAPRSSLNLPLDIRGTVFQQRVWRVLRAIAPGKTLSYRQVAERIGSPGAVRAVANVCGANLLAVAIPCHRVLRTDGTMAGYRWGIERKRQLLKKEASDNK